LWKRRGSLRATSSTPNERVAKRFPFNPSKGRSRRSARPARICLSRMTRDQISCNVSVCAARLVDSGSHAVLVEMQTPTRYADCKMTQSLPSALSSIAAVPFAKRHNFCLCRLAQSLHCRLLLPWVPRMYAKGALRGGSNLESPLVFMESARMARLRAQGVPGRKVPMSYRTS